MPSVSTSRPVSSAESTSWRSTPGLPMAASASWTRLSSSIGAPSTRCSSAATVSSARRTGSTVWRCPSFTSRCTASSGGVLPPVRRVHTTNAVRACTSETSSARDSSSRWLTSSAITTQRRPSPICSSAVRARWNSSPRSSSPSGPAMCMTSARQQMRERGKRHTLGLGMARDPRDREAGVGRQPQALVGKPRLPDTGTAGEEDAARVGIVERRGRRLDLAGSAEERPRRHRRRHLTAAR